MAAAATRTTRAPVGVLFLLVLIAATLVPSQPAAAQSIMSDTRVDFGGVNGETLALRAVGDEVWVGGTFDTATDPDDVTSYPRANLAVFDFNTGQVLPFTADTNDKVKAIETDGESTVWVSGNFTEIRGQAVSYIAAFDVFTGDFKPDFGVVVDYPINALHYNDGWLYIGGEFGQVNGLYYNKLARVDAVTGTVDTSFRADPTATVRSIDSFGDRVYAAGLFETVGKEPNVHERRWVAGFDFATGLPAGPDFVLAPLAPGEGSHKAGVWRVHVSPDGTHLYTADQRNFIIQWDRLTGAQIWSREAEGDIQAVATEGGSIYLGTHDGFLAKGDERLLFALDATHGATDNGFAPTLNSFMGILELEISQGALLGVGAFTEVNGETSPHLVVFHSEAWTGAQPLVRPPSPGDVDCDNGSTILDALVIAQYSADLRTEVTSCPLTDPATEVYLADADVNDDNDVNILDALIIARCAAGLPTVFCA